MLVIGLALVAGAGAATAVVLGLGMLGIQFAIGAANDWFDVELDALSKPAKPIPAGIVSRREAVVVAVVSGGGGLAAAALVGPVPAILAGLMLGAGLAYDALLKPTAWGWLAFAVAFPLLPIYAWYGAAAALPPRPELLLPVAALAGPTLQLANGLVDVERDAAGGIRGLAGRLGRRRALAALVLLQLVINGLAWATLVADSHMSGEGRLIVVAASGLTLVGVVLSAAFDPARREWGWRCQAAAIALLAIGWLMSAG